MIYFVRLYILILNFAVIALASSDDVQLLPKLFHLDEYDRCLSLQDGLYCLGTFELYPGTENNTAYSIIKETLKKPFSFDRRLLYRGYCLSLRCPSKEQNTTAHFKNCVNNQLRKYGLKARMKKLSYCTKRAEIKAKENELPDLPQRIFLYVISFLLFLNVLGTLHDVYGKGARSNLLLAWSLPANWKQLTTTNDRASSMFAHIQSSKVLLHFIVMFSHSALLHYMMYIFNPEELEKAAYSPVNTTLRNGTSLVQIFVLLSCFVTAHGLLTMARNSSTLAVIASRTFKRIIRIAPVYLLVTGYAATWWPRAGSGPLWAPTVGAESAVCRKKFWTHVLFVNNFVNGSDICLVQSWAMAVEIQLFLVSMLVTVLLMKLKIRAVPLLVLMFTASCAFNVTLAYVADLVPMVKIILPEEMRVLFRGSRSYFHLHMSPWSNLPACLFGILLAHIYFEQQNEIKAKKQENSVNIHREEIHENNRQVNENSKQVNENGRQVNANGKENESGVRNRKTREVVSNADDNTARFHRKEEKSEENESTEELNDQNHPLKESTKRKENKTPFFLRYAHCFTFPCLWLWVMVGAHIKEVDSKAVVALYVGMERLMFSLMFAWQMMQMLTIQGPWGRLMSWRGWAVPARLSLSVMMVHWCVAASIAASRPQTIVSTTFYISMDWLATLFYSYLIALPISLFVELPMKKSLDVFIS